MSSLVVDAWAWVEYLDGSELGRAVDRALGGAEVVWTSAVSVAEVVSKYRRSGRDEIPGIRAVTTLSKVAAPSTEDAQEAGRIHAEMKSRVPNFSLSDSFALQLARKTKSKVLTGDPDFAGIKEALVLKTKP